MTLVKDASSYVFSPLRGGELTLNRGSGAGLEPILLVAPAGEYVARECLKRLENEYSLRDELDPEWAAQPLSLAPRDGRMTLVLADPGGELLDRVLGRPLAAAQFLPIAIALASALRRVHERGLIHKDVKPANVLVDMARGGAWLTGFGIASRLPREQRVPDPPEVIAGTLAYMAPEQTGRMNRSIDSRSDLYALGVTFYELLTGALPFTAADPLEWIHCHIARQPLAPSERLSTVPAQLSAIVMKLLAKTAEERYQTAGGVQADLRRCLTDWESRGRIDPFTLGAHDVSDRLLIPEKLYGRERDIDTLVAAFDRVVAGGKPELVLVSGYSGIGKSSLVHELHKTLIAPRGLFASGKFDQYKRDIPYATLAEAFQTLVRRILGKADTELARWRDAIGEAVGANGQLIVNLIPELELIIGRQPEVATLTPQDAQHRFHTVFRRFLGVFASAEHPLVLYLDDLQWLDAATLDLLEHLVTHSDVRHLLLIGAYRDNEVSPSHRLMRMIDAIRSAKATLHEIVLAPLGFDDVNHLVSDTLQCDRERAEPLARLVYEKTAGNPFFTIQFIGALAEQGLLAFDPGAAAWTCDFVRVRAKNFTDNVVDLMVGKLHRLPDATREALKQLACLGNRAETAILSMIHGCSDDDVHAALWKAVRAGLVFRRGGAYTFLHDRVQEAAYALIPDGERPAAHLRIGRILARRTPPEKLDEASFEIVSQFNRGASLISAREELQQVAELNLIAGKRAKAGTAYASALNYFAAGAALLTEESGESRYALMFALEFHRAECEFLTGEVAAAEQRLSMLWRRAQGLVDLAAVAYSLVNLFTSLDRSDRSIEVSLQYLRRVGIDWSRHPTEEEIGREFAEIWRHLGSRSIEELVDLPAMSDPQWRATMDVLATLVNPALFTDKNLLCLVIGRMTNLSLEHGNSDGSSFAYVWLGAVLGLQFGDYRAGFRFGQVGLDLVEKRGFGRFKSRVYRGFAQLVNPWTRPVRTGRGYLRRAFDTAQESGDLNWACYARESLITHLLVSGDPLDEIQREAETGLAFVREARFGTVIDIITGQLALVRTLRGLTPTFGRFDDGDFDEARFEKHLDGNPALAIAACYYWIRKLQARFLAGDYAAAAGAAAKAERLLWTAPAHIEVPEYHFYDALARAAYCAAAPADERPQHWTALTAHREQFDRWAEHCPENFASRAALIAAEIARLESRDLDAMRLYEEAIRLARDSRFIHHEGIANELAARFYAARGFETIANAYLRSARHCYLRWGADGKVRQLEQLHPQLGGEPPAPTPSTAMLGAAVDRLDVGAVVEASQAVSSEIVLDRLVETLMTIALQNAGAERGLLISLRADALRIEAEARTNRQTVEVTRLRDTMALCELPESVLHTVVRTRQSVILDDASVPNPFSEDEYIRRKHARSVLCLPLLKQAKLIGVLYLENNLASHVFTPARLAVLKLLSSQAAISLENASLYADLRQENLDRQKAQDALRRSETYLEEAQRLSNTGSWGWHPSTGEVVWSDETFRIFEYDRAATATLDMVLGRVHPDDRAFVQQLNDRVASDPSGFDVNYRLRMPDGRVKELRVVAHPAEDPSGDLEFVGAVTDITATKRAEEALRKSERQIQQDERELRELLDFLPVPVFVLGPDGGYVHVNQALLDYTGCELSEALGEEFRTKIAHPDDVDRVRSEVRRGIASGRGWEVEARVRGSDGQYRWFLIGYNPLMDEQGRVQRLYGTGIDIEDRKRAEDRIRTENLALREEVDRASMFEEIVGASRALQAVLLRVAKVAPTDSTVLITGETGTGKELIARAIHKRSPRSARAFVSVNCAAIPPSLIASELFGHEKGAFTGALQRRLGRFEMAQDGTIFLDEIGELPAEMQIALLRVLQEHEFERIGGNRSIKVDARVIVATNRDLPTAIAAGTFRSDLFYRLNVFPIEVPSLSERREDIPMLVEYFIDRFARKAGKKIRRIDKTTLELLRSYPWPGNIRELQNVIERSVIVCDTEDFSIDESWLSQERTERRTDTQTLSRRSDTELREVIEAALAEAGGRVSGPTGAAAKLGLPASTLESRIRSLKINKHRFKSV